MPQAAQTTTVISIASGRCHEPMQWPSLTYGQLFNSLGHILQEIRMRIRDELELENLPIVNMHIDLTPFAGSKDLLWEFACVGGSSGSYIVRCNAYENGNAGRVCAWGHFVIGQSRAHSSDHA